MQLSPFHFSEIIHGDLDISNVIFDYQVKKLHGTFRFSRLKVWLLLYVQHKVKAIVDWKWDMNGDPLSDVANFTMMFLQPEEVGQRFRPLAGHELLLGMNMTCNCKVLFVAGSYFSLPTNCTEL